MMDANIVLALISLIMEKGIPAYIQWQDGVKLENPTLEDFEALKVKKMSEKVGD
jgi:hypothetical protein